MANELETRIATLERQVIELTKLINTSQTSEKASAKLAAASTPASTKAKRVTLSEGTTIDVIFHQQ